MKLTSQFEFLLSRPSWKNNELRSQFNYQKLQEIYPLIIPDTFTFSTV